MADVVVIGSGAAGLTTATLAAGIDAEGLASTVAAWNANVEQGECPGVPPGHGALREPDERLVADARDVARPGCDAAGPRDRSGRHVVNAAWFACVVLVASAPNPPAPPPDASADYQIGGAYDPPAGVTVVTRDWFLGEPIGDGYSICYVNAFQTQDDGDGVDRPDERSNWPGELVLSELGDDPNWGGEYLVDIGTAESRAAAFVHVEPMIDTCAEKGFDAVELDNLDSWTRFDDTALEGEVPFGRNDAIAYAELLVDSAHASGLAVGQKNTLELGAEVALDVIGFDFAVVEECGAYDECDGYVAIYGDRVIDIEYTADGFDHACATVGDTVSVVRRDVEVTAPGSVTYIYDSC